MSFGVGLTAPAKQTPRGQGPETQEQCLTQVSGAKYAPTLASDCLILGPKQAFTREVPMDDPDAAS
jgi:hypothetical protein